MKELGSSHVSTSNLEVVGYQLLLVPPFECSIRDIIKGLHDVGAVGGGKQQTSLLCSFIHCMYLMLNRWLLWRSNSTRCFWSGLHRFLSLRKVTVFSIISKHISIYVARLCCLDHVARWCHLTPLVFHSSSFEENHGGDHHPPSTDVCHHCAGFSFFTRYSLESSLSFDPNNLL